MNGTFIDGDEIQPLRWVRVQQGSYLSFGDPGKVQLHVHADDDDIDEFQSVRKQILFDS